MINYLNKTNNIHTQFRRNMSQITRFINNKLLDSGSKRAKHFYRRKTYAKNWYSGM